MDFIKKNYEKVILGVVLLGLVVGAVFLTLMVPAERRSLEEKATAIINRPPKPLPALDLTGADALLARLRSPFILDLTTTNKLVNPMIWRKRLADNAPIKDVPRNIGPEALVVTTNRPLYLTLSFDNVNTSGTSPRYLIGVIREASKDRTKRQRDAALNVKNDVFVLREVKGPADAPSELVLELNDSGEMVTLTKDRAFRRVDAWVADLRYTPENKSFQNKRVNDVVPIDGEIYKIVAINKNEVILSAPNNKKTSIPYNAVP